MGLAGALVSNAWKRIHEASPSLAAPTACLLFAAAASADEAPMAPPEPVPEQEASQPVPPPDSEVETIVVTGRPMALAHGFSVHPARLSPAVPDAAAFVKLIPGAGGSTTARLWARCSTAASSVRA